MINFSITVSFAARKSAVFPKRPSSSENLINTSNTSLNDKENNKPTSVSALTQKPPTSGFFSNKTASNTNDDKPKTIESTKPVKKPSFTSANTGSDESNKVLPAEVKPDVRSEVTKATPPVPAEVPKVRTSEAFSKFQQEASVMPSSKPTTTSPEITKGLPEVNKGLPEVSKVTSAIGWKPAVLQSNNSASVEDVDDELNLEQRVSKLGVSTFQIISSD